MPMHPVANDQAMPSGAQIGDYPSYTLGDWALQSPQEGCSCNYCEAYNFFVHHIPFPLQQAGAVSAGAPTPSSFFATAQLNDNTVFSTQNISVTLDESQDIEVQGFPMLKPKKRILKTEEVVQGGIKIKSSSEIHQELCKGKFLYLIRGVSGSGKSTLAYLLSMAFRKGVGISSAIREVDQEFSRTNVDGETVYFFEESKLPNAHEKCQEGVKRAMSTESGLGGGMSAIFVANPFISRQQLVPYQRLAREFGYQVVEIVCKGTFESPHEIPFDEVRRTKQRFEN